MAGKDNEGLNAVREFLKTTPHATPDQIREVADKYNFPLTFGGTDADPDEPGFGKFTYTSEDLTAMGWSWLQDEEKANEAEG